MTIYNRRWLFGFDDDRDGRDGAMHDFGESAARFVSGIAEFISLSADVENIKLEINGFVC